MNEETGARACKLQLLFFAAAALYLELVAIRFTAAEVLYLGYFTNFVLITAFVGLGCGFLSHARGINLDTLIPFSLLFLFALVLVSEFDVDILRNHFGLFFFGNVSGRAGLPGALLLVILFLTTAALFASIGARVAKPFAMLRPLTAYSFDVGGSLLGIGLFSVQSALAAGPVTWVITGCGLLILAFAVRPEPGFKVNVGRIALTAVCVVTLLLSADRGTPTVWSTYQKLELRESSFEDLKILYANGVGHQYLHPVDSVRNTYYSIPYKLMAQLELDLDEVLIIGAGTGTDVAMALAWGAGHVDAVEIDRRILEFGIEYHPDHPYADPRVSLHVEDGRRFLQQSSKRYDLILFALPDSLTRLSALSSVRLESYLFTKESFASAREHLGEKGLFVLYNEYRWDWLVARLSQQLEREFGKRPMRLNAGEATVLAASGFTEGFEYDATGFERLATDDWPFVYLQRPAIHWLYMGMIGMFVLSSLVAVSFLAPPGTLRHPDLPFFFMGMAFLLLETKSLAFFSLLFGTTWLVNALAFGGILISVLLANWTVQFFNIRARGVLFGGILLALLLAYLLPARLLLGIDSEILRYVAAILVVFTPIFLANLIFSREFRDHAESTRAFGWNLLGAVAGGGLEYLSLKIGFSNLLWVVAAAYLAVYLSLFRRASLPATG